MESGNTEGFAPIGPDSPALANNLMSGCKWNEVGKPLQRDAVFVMHIRGNRLGQCEPIRHSPPFH
jgi:hypothetical protein